MEAPTPQVSIVIPTCNRRDTLARCLEALRNQTYQDFEVIIVDDGSSDDTPQFLQAFCAESVQPCFRWYRNEPQAGANPSRNRGIQAARGEYVAFLDDDAIAAPDWLRQLTTGFASESVVAVTGRVHSAPPRNLFDLTMKGTQRVAGRVQATRLVGCNMCVRRDFLLAAGFDEDRASASPDTTVSARGDEDGLFLRLRAAGFEARVVHDAAVVHEHYYTGRSFFRQAFRGGAASARLGYKYYLPPRIELTPLLLAYLTLPLILLGPAGALVPAVFAAIFLAAILYNDLFRKRKTIIETLVTLPLLIAFYHVRMVGYWLEFVRLRVGKSGIRRVRLGTTTAHES
jgi:glycosyltransferase involved in cell wall biosynthesis